MSYKFVFLPPAGERARSLGGAIQVAVSGIEIAYGDDRDQALAGQALSKTSKNQVAEQLRRADRAGVPNLVDFPTDATTLQIDRRDAVRSAGEDKDDTMLVHARSG